MARSNVKFTGKSNNQIDEAPVPLRLRITVSTLLALGAAPARLRRTRAGWLLSASPSLVTFQRLIAVIFNAMTISYLIVDFQFETKYRVHVGSSVLVNCMSILEASITVLMHSLGVSAALDMRLMLTMLQEIHKIKHSLNRIPSHMKYDRLKQSLLTFYIIWNIVTHVASIGGDLYNHIGNLLVASLWAAYLYQILVAALIQLHWSVALEEINCTLTFINDNLEILLKRTVTIVPKFGCNSMRLLNVSYDTIFELLGRLHAHYGAFLSIYLLFLFLSLLISPYNLIVSLGLKNPVMIGQQVNWTILHFIQFTTLVEPCHRIKKQKQRTRRLLSALTNQANRRQFPLHLKPFILQILISESSLALCDTFTISRSTLATVIGGVVTYLIIIVQAQQPTELI